MVIHSHDTLPPIVCGEPASYDGCTGLYWPATPAGAREAVEYHRAAWPDWELDAEVVVMAAQEDE